MKMVGKRLAVIGCVAIGISAAAGIYAQGKGDLRLYKGEPVVQAGMTISSWGSGEVRESEDKVYIGGKSLKVTTHGRYQGARLLLQNPIDLKVVANDPSAYLQFTVALAPRDS